MKPQTVWFFAGALLLAACSNKALIMKKDDGSFVAVAKETEVDAALDEAREGAEIFCKKQNKTPMFSSDETKYVGKMDEDTRNTIRKASTAGIILGGGGAMGQAGMVGHTMTSDKDYRAQLGFRCE